MMQENKGLRQTIKRTSKDYSLAFKLQVVDEVEKGLLNQDQAQRKYGIQGNATILTWLRKHGRLNWYQTNPMTGKITPQSKIKELEKKIKRLEAEKLILNRAIDIADEMFDTNIRKKYLPLSEAASKSQGQSKDHQE
jgi:transposase-like protein